MYISYYRYSRVVKRLEINAEDGYGYKNNIFSGF